MTDRAEVERLLREQAERHARRAAQAPGYLAARNPEHGKRQDQERIKQAAFAELFARGLDPKRLRRFRGRIDLTVACQPKGHELANVYPTKFGQVFVPAVAELPYRKEPLPPGSRQRRLSRETLETFTNMGLPVRTTVPGQERDTWIQVFENDDEGDPQVFIRGAGLVDRERWKDPKYDDAGHSLLCRCGTRSLWVRQLEQALDSGTRRLFV